MYKTLDTINKIVCKTYFQAKELYTEKGDK